MPLVELRTVNAIRYVTDSNGIVAFDEPGLLGRKVFFHIQSHGYEFPKDGFGYRGLALETSAGGSARLKIKRLNIARRLYRITGAGIYRDSLLTGASIPINEPILDGQVLGQDSVLTALFEGKIFWFWGDTNRPGYPLGNFHTPGATSERPGQGGLDPAQGVNLSYFVNESGFARPTCELPGAGPTWVDGLVVLTDDQGKELMFAQYAKIRPPLEIYQRGLVEFDSRTRTFQKRAEYPSNLAVYPARLPGLIPSSARGEDALHLLLRSLSAHPRARRSRVACRPTEVGGLHLPGAGNPVRPGEARSWTGRPLEVWLEVADPACFPGAAGKADQIG